MTNSPPTTVTNPEKSGEWYIKATAVHQRTDSLYNYIASLKQRIVREADGKNGAM